jgi:transcriptional regulator with XRE-family HTH domain
MVRKSHSSKKFKTLAEAMDALGYTDQQAADILGMHRSRITRLRRGEKFACLRKPLLIARTFNVPIENLVADDAA